MTHNIDEQKPTYGEIKEVAKALDDAKVPTENRTFRIAKHAFLELGGTEESWQKLNRGQDK